MAILCLGTKLQGQIVNIEDKRRTLDSIGWAGQLDFSGQLTQNTRRIFTFSTVLRLDRQSKQGAYLLLGNYNLVRAGDDRFVNDGFGHLRYGHRLNTRWTWESFGQLQYNRRLQIQLRGLLGTGPRFQITRGDRARLAGGMLYMYEYNELNRGDIFRRDDRMSFYLSVRYLPKPYLQFNSTSYYQPLINDWFSARLSTVNTLVILLSERLRLTSSLSLVYDGLLARLTEQAVPGTTYQWKNGIRFQF